MEKAYIQKNVYCRMKNALLPVLSFIIAVQIGCFTIEYFQHQTARSLGYEGRYIQGAARSLFHSNQMQDELDQIIEKYRNDRDQYRSSSEWQKLLQLNLKNLALIELYSRIFASFISVIGLLVFFFRRKSSKEMAWRDWLAIFFGLFFMRFVILDFMDLSLGFFLCDSTAIWQYLNLPVKKSMLIGVVIGSALFLSVIYYIPKSSRNRFTLYGLIGSLTGALLWWVYLGELLLG